MIYTLELELYAGHFGAKFAFSATSSNDARIKAQNWGRYHGYSPGRIRVREATETEAENWLHNEYIELTN